MPWCFFIANLATQPWPSISYNWMMISIIGKAIPILHPRIENGVTNQFCEDVTELSVLQTIRLYLVYQIISACQSCRNTVSRRPLFHSIHMTQHSQILKPIKGKGFLIFFFTKHTTCALSKKYVTFRAKMIKFSAK